MTTARRHACSPSITKPKSSAGANQSAAPGALGSRLQSRWSAVRACGALVNRRTIAHGADVRVARRSVFTISCAGSGQNFRLSRPCRAGPIGARGASSRRLSLPRGTAIRRTIASKVRAHLRHILKRLNGTLQLFPKAWNLIGPMMQMKPRTPVARRLYPHAAPSHQRVRRFHLAHP